VLLRDLGFSADLQACDLIFVVKETQDSRLESIDDQLVLLILRERRQKLDLPVAVQPSQCATLILLLEP